MSINTEKIESLLPILEKANADFYGKVKILLDKMTKTEQLQFLQSQQMEQMLYDLGVSEYMKRYDSTLASQIATTLKGYSKFIAKDRAKIVVNNANLLKNSKILTAKGMVDSSIKTMKSSLLESVIFGTPFNETVKKLESIPLTTAQLKTFVNTAYADINRDTTAIAFAGDKETRFSYEGGLIPTSSDICTWLIENQKPEGYLMDEIIAGIKTPDGIIDWNGRIPNFNCIHFWSLIT